MTIEMKFDTKELAEVESNGRRSGLLAKVNPTTLNGITDLIAKIADAFPKASQANRVSKALFVLAKKAGQIEALGKELSTAGYKGKTSEAVVRHWLYGRTPRKVEA